MVIYDSYWVWYDLNVRETSLTHLHGLAVGAGFGFTYSTFEQFAKIGVSVRNFGLQATSGTHKIGKWLMLLHFSLAVAADVYIAAALVSYLLRSRPKLSGTGFQSDAFKRCVVEMQRRDLC